MISLKEILCVAAGCFYLCAAHAQNQNTSGKETYIVSGNVGASASFYTSNETISTRQPFAWSTYGSFTVSKRRFQIPVSFVVSQYGNSHASTYSQFGISPTLKWATLHLGDRYVFFSPFVFQGQSFRGAGLDLKPGIFRFTAFYGRLTKAVNGDTSARQYAPLQFLRKGYGVRIGIGNANSFFDLMYFHAKDDSASASFAGIHNQAVKDSLQRPVAALENAVVGASFRVRILKKIFVAGDMAVSGLTNNLGSDTFRNKFLDTVQFPHRAIVKRLYDAVNNRLMQLNTSSIFSYAGQSSLSFASQFFNSSVIYRRVEPEFRSLGTSYLTDDVEQASLFNNLSVVKGRLNITTTLSEQHNNLNKQKNVELHAFVGTVNINALVSRHFNMNVNYSGYSLEHKDKTISTLPDSLKQNYPLLKQQISQINLTPTYNFTTNHTQQFISGNVNISGMQNKNPDTSSHINNNNKNLSTSLSYSIGLLNKPLNFSVNGLYNQYKVETSAYISYGASVGASVQLLKQKNLNVQGNVGMIFNRYPGDVQRNITYSANIGYSAHQHTFNLFANCVYTPYNTIANTIKETFSSGVTTTNVAGGISYNYSF